MTIPYHETCRHRFSVSKVSLPPRRSALSRLRRKCLANNAKEYVFRRQLCQSSEELLQAIADDQIEKAKRLIRMGIDLKVPFDQGASVLFAAILGADVSLVRLMLEHGANPNFVAEEPAATFYAENPLELAQGAWFLLDRDKYQPIAEL